MTALGDMVRAAKATGSFSALIDTIPYLRFIGLAADTTTGELVVTMAHNDRLVGNAMLPALHGGAIGALLESTAFFQVLWTSDTVGLPKLVTITIDFLRPGRPVDTFARSIVTKQGRRIVNVRVDAWQESVERPIARANAVFLVRPTGESEGTHEEAT